MEPLKSNQIALQVDMTATAVSSQAVKKLRTPKFVPYEPTKAAVGETIDRSPTECSISVGDRLITNTPAKLQFDKKLHRYSKTVYIGKKSLDQMEGPPTPIIRESMSTALSPAQDKFRPINVVDPIIQDNANNELSEDYVVEIEEPCTESRATAHLQALNDACNLKIVQLRDERSELKKELELQFQINAELKKLLVASMGDEMHHDVEMLVRQRTQLSSEIDNYCRKIQDNQETLDKMNIMADIWRSKYIASRVMIDELASWKAHISVRYNEARSALHGLLNERHQIKAYVASALRYLQQIHSTLYHSGSSRPPAMQSNNLIDMSKQANHLAENVKFKFLGNVPVTVQAMDGDDLTPAERTAAEALSHASGADQPSHQSPYNCAVGRFHPDTRFELLTLNCCSHCKGEIKVI